MQLQNKLEDSPLFVKKLLDLFNNSAIDGKAIELLLAFINFILKRKIIN